MALIGELGLAGELRDVEQLEKRIASISQLGIKLVQQRLPPTVAMPAFVLGCGTAHDTRHQDTKAIGYDRS